MKGYSKKGKKLPYWGKTRRLMRVSGKRTLHSFHRTSADTSYHLYSERRHIKELRRWKRQRLIRRVIAPLSVLFIAIIFYLFLAF